MWLQLHSEDRDILVNTDHIVSVYPDIRQRKKFENYPAIIVLSQSRATIHVLDSYIDIVRMLTE